MPRHKGASEPARTTSAPHAAAAAVAAAAGRAPPAPTDLEAFADHFAATVDFTDALRDGRCRRTDHFTKRIGETVDVFRPLFAPWNAEIVFSLYMHGAQRFSALKRRLDGISSRVLTDKLRHLESESFVARAEDADAVTYTLTPRGERVARLLHPLIFFLHNEERLLNNASHTHA